MPSLVGSLYVSLTADFGSYQRNMKSAENVTAQTTTNIRRHMGLTEKSVNQLHRGMNNGIRPGALIAAGRSFDSLASRANLLRGAVFAVTAAFGGLGAALTSNVISRYLDSFTGLSNQMRVVSSGSADLAANIDAVAGVAERSRSSLSAVATLYSRIAKAAPGEGALRTLRRVETINKALQLGGATAQEAASAAIQFSQAIASNRLGGEELRAVLETPLGLELAKGIGVTIGELRKMGFEGKLTADVLFKALDKISGTIDGQFAQSVSTIDQALTVADGKITVFAGKLDQTYGITKLLTGGIIGLANNLDTILPLLASVGLGLGTTFAARRVGPGIGNRVSALRAENAIRKDNLRLAGEELAVANQQRAAAVDQLRKTNQRAQGDARQFASPSAVKRYERDLGAIQKLDAQRLSQLEEMRQVQYQIGQVTRQSTTKAVSASEKLAAAQAKVNEGLSKRWSISSQLQRVDKQLANLPQAGVAPNWLFPADVDKQEKDLLGRRKKLAADLARIDEGLTRNRETLAEREARVSQLGLESERKAATERAGLLRRHQQLMTSMERTQARRGAFAGSLRAAGAGVLASGLSNVGGAQLDTAQAAIAAQTRYAEAQTRLSAAAKAAGLASQGLNVLKGAGMSLVGFLGGPWGAAFTAAIGILTIFGMRSRASAEEIARGTQVIQEELAKLEAANGLSGQTVNQQLAITDAKIVAETERLKAAQAVLNQSTSDLINGISQGLAQQTGLGGVEFLQRFTLLADKLAAGKMSITDFIAELQKLGLSADQVDAVTASMNEAIAKGQTAEQTIDLIGKRLAELNGKRAEITVRVNLDDPRGVFQLQNDGTGANKRLAQQYAQYGAGRASAGNQTFLQNQRESAMAAAGEQNNVANTPQKILERAQALYEEGAAYGLTRAEAEKLAKAELDMTEQTRLAGQSSRSSAKDFENFANKLAELRAEAEGAYLSDIDQKVIDFAKSLKDGSGMIREYVAAINSGDLSKAPEQLLQARAALLEIGAASTWQGILQQYGTAGQLAAQFADKQAELNLLVANGRITAEQAGLAWADFLGQFEQYEWIDELASAFGNFAQSAIMDFENIEDSVKNLLQQILNLIVQLLVVEPLMRAIKSGIGGAIGGGASGGGYAGAAANVAAGIFTGLYHKGGKVGRPSSGRRVPASAGIGAPRFHSGLNGNEFMSILEKGERVLTGKQEARTAATIAGLSAAVGGGRGREGVDVRVGIDDDGKLQAYVLKTSAQTTQEGLRKYDKTSSVRFPRDARNAKSRGGI